MWDDSYLWPKNNFGIISINNAEASCTDLRLCLFIIKVKWIWWHCVWELFGYDSESPGTYLYASPHHLGPVPVPLRVKQKQKLQWLTHTPVTCPVLPQGNFRLNSALAAGNQESAAIKPNTLIPADTLAWGNARSLVCHVVTWTQEEVSSRKNAVWESYFSPCVLGEAVWAIPLKCSPSLK